jgi:hemoglobin
MKKILVSLFILSSLALSHQAVMAQNAPADMAPAPIEVYKAFGEKPGLVKLMDDFMVRLVANPITEPRFANANQAHIKMALVEQFCQVLSGPCTYTGRDMKSTHQFLKIDMLQFNALVEELQRSMAAMDIPFSAQNQLLAQLAPMYRVIVTQ